QAAPSWRFWGLYLQGGQWATLRDAYPRAKANNGAPGSAGVPGEALEASGLDAVLEPRRDALVPRTSPPMRWRQKASPQEGGHGLRVLAMPTIRDRVVQGALQRLREPIFAADCQPGAYGDRPKRSAPDAVQRVAEAMVPAKPRGIDVARQADCDHLRHPIFLAQ